MTLRHIIVPGADLSAGAQELPAPAARHVARVLRMEAGDELLLLDGRGGRAKGVIAACSPSAVTLRLEPLPPADGPVTPELHLIQALPKSGTKLDEIVRRATELGATSITPVVTQRSVPRPSKQRAAKRLARWQRIATEASRQCRRTHLPQVSELMKLDEALRAAAETATLRIILDLEETTASLAARLAEGDVNQGVTVAVGPEGGFDDEEVELATELGFTTASLGPLVLRVETAAIAAVTLSQHYLGGLEPGAESDE